MEADWTTATDAKEKKRIQNRVAQRVHREKLKSRIRQLEEQLEIVTSAAAQNDTSKQWYPCGDSVSSCAMPGVLPTMTSEPITDGSGTGPNDITFAGNHASKSLLGTDTAIESGLNAIPQNSIVTQLDPLSQTPAEGQYMDLDWLLAGSGASKIVPEHTQDPSPLMERGSKNPNHSQGPSGTSPPQHLGSSDHVQVGGNSSHVAHKTTTAPMAKNNGHETLSRSDASELERLSLLAECSRRLGFNDLNEALSAYYTSDLSASAVLSHEQSLNRVKQLPNFLSKIREHSKHWPTWERANYVRETLTSAEDVYAEECRLARMNLANQGIIALTQKEFQVGQMFQITRVLQQEIPNTWALITSIILHTNMPGEPQPPQTILMVMMLLCCRTQDPVTTLGLCQEYLFQHGTNNNGPDPLHLKTN